MQTSKEILGHRITTLRNSRNMTIEELSYKTDIDYSYLCKIIKGTVNCSLEKLISLADALGIEVKELFVNEEIMTRDSYIQGIQDIIEDMDIRKLQSVYTMALEIKRLTE